jgi:amidase
MSLGIKLPTVDQLRSIAEDLCLEISEAEAFEYRGLMRSMTYFTQQIEDLPELRPAVKYPRTPGYKPYPKDNPFNAWYWRTDISGASNGRLQGFTVGVKDSICVAGVPAMNGSRVLEGYIPDIDATVVTRLLDEGAKIIGKTNADDFCMSGSGHTSAAGPVLNPCNLAHGAGGSSAGSAAALAAGDVQLALGTDQGGSIRIPASWCGVVGLKPTYGLVPYTGCMMMEMTLDHVGPMARTVEDCARMLEVIAGPDPMDPRQRGVFPSSGDKNHRNYLSAIDKDAKGMRVAAVKEGFSHAWPNYVLPRSEEVVDKAVRSACHDLENLGVEVDQVSIPMHSVGVAIYRVLFQHGVMEFMIKGNGLGSNWFGYYNTSLNDALARGMRTRPNDLPSPVQALMLSAEYMKQYYQGRYYAKAQNLRDYLTIAYDEVLSKYDALAMPTVGHSAVKIPPADCSITDTLQAAGTAIGNACQACLTGHPSITVPCGVANDLPIGLMLTGKRFDEYALLRLADCYQRARR